jgi:hypothetical protein
MTDEHVALTLPQDLAKHLHALAQTQGHTLQEVIVAELRRAMSRFNGGASSKFSLARDQSSTVTLTSPVSDHATREPPALVGLLAPAAPTPPGLASCVHPARVQIIGLVEGLLTGETTMREVLCKGDFGLGTLNHVRGCRCPRRAHPAAQLTCCKSCACDCVFHAAQPHVGSWMAR